jgi:predicted amidophosphoribosyltransferase
MAIRMLPALHRVVDSPHPILVPVPLAPARRRERGFNQAELLADALSELTGWEVADLLCRVRGGPSQARLGRRQRERRAAGAYAIDPGVAEGLVSYTQMGTDGTGCETEMSALVAVVVDDVITTGSTAGACAAGLEAAGLECLGAVSFARTAPALEAG